jgi:enoyl-CoA hydratase
MAWRRAASAALASASRAGIAPPSALLARTAGHTALPPSASGLAGLRGVLVPTVGTAAGVGASVRGLASKSASGHASSSSAQPPPVVSVSRPSPHTVLLTLNRPAALNALNTETMHALVTAAADADRDPAARAVVITGNGDRAFAAGADVRELAAHTYSSAVSARLLDGWRALKHVRLPLVAAVEGFALGGGCELAMACDLVVAGSTATFGQPEVGLGVVPGMGATQRLPRAVGKALAMDLILTGRRLTAEEALAAGLVSRVVPAGSALQEALAAAAAIARSPRGAVAKAKELTNAAFEMPLSAGLETELRDFWACFGTDEQVEGMAAFLEKRAPKVG